MIISNALGFLLGLEGVALLRASAGDFPDGAAFAEARLAEIRAMLAADQAEFGEVVELDALDVNTGYRDWSNRYDEEDNPLIAVEQPVVRSILETLPVGKALDAACGTGRHGQYLVKLGHQVVGVDGSAEMLALAQDKMPDARFHLGDINAMPLASAEFDVVVCALALTHLTELESVFREFHRVLKPGGHLVLSDIHVASLYLGGIAGATDAEGRPGHLPASRWLPSHYLQTALPLGLQVRGCVEPRWGGDTGHGGPQARRWCPEAATAAYRDTPAAIVWHFQKG
ncbi:methyltransferase domain-containing protein [Stackebrandtia soli]|uniref:methyltransferase domain-containing protein n=1 Tax=Stackebrandtia soli TaxID=1892856 RepID=UPI0039E81D71